MIRACRMFPRIRRFDPHIISVIITPFVVFVMIENAIRQFKRRMYQKLFYSTFWRRHLVLGTILLTPWDLVNEYRDIAITILYWFVTGISGQLSFTERLRVTSTCIRFFVYTRRWLETLTEMAIVLTLFV